MKNLEALLLALHPILYRVVVCGLAVYLGHTEPEERTMAVFLLFFGIIGPADWTPPKRRTMPLCEKL